MTDKSVKPRPTRWNPQTTLQRMGDDREMLRDMVQFFEEDAPPLLDELRAAVSSEDARSAHRAAHSLKGLCATLDALPAVEAARSVESAAGTGDLQATRPLIPALEQEITALQAELHEWCREEG